MNPMNPMNTMNPMKYLKINKIQSLNRLPIWISLGILASSYLYFNKIEIQTRLNTFLNSKNNSTTNDLLFKVLKEDQLDDNDIKNYDIQSKKKKSILTVYSNDKYFEYILQYIYKKWPDKINNYQYKEEKVYKFNDWRERRKEDPSKIKILIPHECNFNTIYTYQDTKYQINIDLRNQKNKNEDYIKILEQDGCLSEENLLKKLTITLDNDELDQKILISLVDDAKKEIQEDYDKYRKTTNETMNIYYFRKEYWNLLSKSPKRPKDTIYLKQGQLDNLVQQVETFFSKETRNIYLSFGIPYKSIYMIYGPPGSGKTSTIRGIASTLDCDLYILPITKDMLDTNLVDAFSYINDKEDKQRIIVIEDIDTLFDERKEGDKNNGITLQGFLNCLDGFTCIEGTMLFVTANKPEVLDYALIRSCRIDHKLELGYADKYQTKQMFTKFLPNQLTRFEDFYSEIQHKEFTTAALQEYLFYNRKCENILKHMDELIDIIDKNDPKKFEILKDGDHHLYS